MKVLVTGSEGFIGSNLIQYTSPTDFEPVRCDLFKKPGVIACDLTRNFPELPQGIDACIHLASHNIDKIDARSEVEATVNNLRIIDNVLEGCYSNGIRLIVNVSSSSVYGSSSSPLLESQSGNPINAYGFSQLQVEHACDSLSRDLGLTVLSVRLFNVLGFNQKQSMLPWRVLKSMDTGLPLDLFGESYQSWTYVRPVVDFLRMCVHIGNFFGKGHHVFNYGSSTPMSKLDLIGKISDLVKTEPKYNKLARRPSDVLVSYPSMTKTLQVFGPTCTPHTDITPAITELVCSYRHTKASMATSVEEYDSIMEACFSHAPQPVSTVFQRT